jgi:hypothetical protein
VITEWALYGHTGRINAVAFSADSKLAVSAGNDGTICVWQTRDGRILSRLCGHAGPVTGVALTPNGRELISGGADGTVRIWDVRAGREARRLEGPDAAISCVDVSPDGRTVIAGANFLWVWQTRSGKLLHWLKPYWFMWVRSAVVLPDSRHVLVGGERRIPIYTLDLRTGETVAEWPVMGKSTESLAVSPDGRMAASWCDMAGTIVWQRRTGEPLFYWEDYACALQFTPDSACLVSADAKHIVVRELQDGSVIAQHAPVSRLACLAISPNGRHILTGNEDGTLSLLLAKTE